MKKTFHITTFGCQMNKLDSELIQAALQRHDYVPVADQEDAGVVLYNTCSVRDQAENRVLSHLGTFRERAEEDPDFILGVTGCMAQRMGEQLTHKFPFVNLVCGTRRFLQIPDYLNHIRETGESIVALDQDPLESQPAPESRLVGHQAYVSIMRGCNNFCAYCIVPHVRGREKSRPMGEIKTEVQRLVEEGAVPVDEHLRTEVPNVYAAGDIARVPSPLTGESHRIEHWAVAERQGQHAARAMMGSEEPYREVPFFWTMQFETPLKYTGYPTDWDQMAVRGDVAEGNFLVGYYTDGDLTAVAASGRTEEFIACGELLKECRNIAYKDFVDPDTDIPSLLD